MKMYRFITVLALAFGLSLLAYNGYASSTPTKAPMGSMKADAAAKKAFEEGKMLMDHTYYYLGGSIVEPDTIIAIKKGYTLRENRIWSKVEDMSDRVIRGWIQAWKNDGHQLSELNGGVLLAPDGTQVGIWYSHFPGSVVMMPIPGVLDVFQPHPIVGDRPGQGA